MVPWCSKVFVPRGVAFRLGLAASCAALWMGAREANVIRHFLTFNFRRELYFLSYAAFEQLVFRYTALLL